jgi:GTP cyclohydrolase II
MLVQASGHRLTTFDAYAQMGLGADTRRYDAVTAICELAGIRAPLLLLTNNPQKVAALELAAVRVAEVEPLDHAASPFNQHYVASKRRSGHRLALEEFASEAAELPEAVSEMSPRSLPDAPDLVQHACYLLPVRVRGRAPDAPLWLRLHAYLDEATGAERVVLSIGDPRAAGAVVSVQEQVLLERLLLRQAPAADDWTRTLARFAEVGAGVAVFLSPGQPKDVVDPTTSALLAHHGGASAAL